MEKNGKIVTFYSFKGGVGRTMALANVALLAAMNGKRVLVMDWDLEAPGLEYYFRGLFERTRNTSIGDSPGVLNILSEWSEGVDTNRSEAEFLSFRSEYDSGEKFSRCARSLVEREIADKILPNGSSLDIINAGSRLIGVSETPYEEVLAAFSWKSFFDEKAGGYLLQALREWALRDYDIVLIDSRTGLADVAGICTLLLPDIVALCFILNQQNIDGVAKVAAAITSQAAGRIVARAIPMRVSRRDSAEGSDAQARAISALSRIGGISRENVKSDFHSLYIAFEDNIPFYETLAPLIATDPSLDPLTLSYMRLTKELLFPEMSLPNFPNEILKIIRARLVPRNATAQYVKELMVAEPTRAQLELTRLVEIATDSAVENVSLDIEYVAALVESSLNLATRVDEPEDGYVILAKVLRLVKYLAESNPEEWRITYVDTIRESLDIMWVFDKATFEIELREDLERLLANDEKITARLARLENLQETARLFMQHRPSETTAVAEALDKMQSILGELSQDVSIVSPEYRSLRLTMATYYLLRGEVELSLKNVARAQSRFEEGLSKLDRLFVDDPEGQDVSRIRFRLHFALATLPKIPIKAAAEHAIGAAKQSAPEIFYFLKDLMPIVLRAKEFPPLVSEFAAVVFGDANRRRKIIALYSRQDETIVSLLETLVGMLRAIRCPDYAEQEGARALMDSIIELAGSVSKSRRRVASEVFQRISEVADEMVSDVRLPLERSQQLASYLENIGISIRSSK